MQPLTPNERRLVEQVKELIIRGYGSIYGVAKIPDDNYDLVIEDVEQNKELWLKVLSMCLVQNETLEENWRKK